MFAEIDPTYAGVRGGPLRRGHQRPLAARRLAAPRSPNPDDHVILDDVISKEPLGPVAPLGDDQWFNVVKWVVYATIEAEELGITPTNVAETAASSDNPVVQRLLGVTTADAVRSSPASASRPTGSST